MRNKILHKTTLNYMTVNSLEDYDNTEWLYNPDLINVTGIDKQYWKVENDLVVEMTEEEKTTVNNTFMYHVVYEGIFKLWSYANDYNMKFFSGGIYSRILEMKLNGDTKMYKETIDDYFATLNF